MYRSYRGKNADAHRGEYWRQYEPYCFLLNREKKVAYPLNRFYKQIGQPKDVGWIEYPEHDNGREGRIYLYNDGSQPFKSLNDCRVYIEKIQQVMNEFELKYSW